MSWTCLPISDDMFYYLGLFILILVIGCVIRKLSKERVNVFESFAGMEKDIKDRTVSHKESLRDKLIKTNREISTVLDINTHGKTADGQPIYKDILEELEDGMELAQLTALLKFVDTDMSGEKTIELGKALNSYKEIREACKEAKINLAEDRFS